MKDQIGQRVQLTITVIVIYFILSVSAFSRPAPPMDCSAQLDAFNISQTMSLSSNLFLDPVLHACIRAHPYNTDQLPLRVGEPQVPIEMTYNFFFTNLLLFESDGTIGFKAFLRFEWQDSNRVWNRSQLNVSKVRLPFQEVWTPQISLANCESELCHILPHNRTSVGVEHDGRVSLVVQMKQSATCVMNLRVSCSPVKLLPIKKLFQFLLDYNCVTLQYCTYSYRHFLLTWSDAILSFTSLITRY